MLVRPARYKALAWARDRFEGSLAQSFLQRLKALDVASQAMLFGAGSLVSLLPFVILLSAFASQRVDDDISLRLGLDRQAAGIVDHLFTSAPATLSVATATSLVFLIAGMLAVASSLQGTVLVAGLGVAVPVQQRRHPLLDVLPVHLLRPPLARCAFSTFVGLLAGLPHMRADVSALRRLVARVCAMTFASSRVLSTRCC